MNTIDFSKSFLTFRVDTAKRVPPSLTHKPLWSLNNARIQIECRCWIKDKQSNEEEEFVLGASCKTERVGVVRDIWLQPNADFAPVLSRRQFLCVKTYDRVGRTMPLVVSPDRVQPDRHCWPTDEVFDGLQIDLFPAELEALCSPEAIVNATLANYSLVARTQMESDRYLVELDYPVKTINASERQLAYQTDTGPVLLPDLSRSFDDMINGLELAYCAFNCPSWIEFLVRVPTEVAPGVSVYHYSHPVRWDVQNTVYQLHRDRENVQATAEQLRSDSIEHPGLISKLKLQPASSGNSR